MRTVLFKIVALVLFALVSVFTLGAKSYIVAVGISDYPGTEQDLTKCSFDAESIKTLYEGNTDASVVLLKDTEATAKNISQVLNSAFAEAQEDDIILFFFSGHGYPGGFMTYKGNLDYGTIRKAMAKSKAKNKMIFADACFSGKIRTPKKAKESEESAKKANVMLFLSSRHNETSLEVSNLQNGLFTHYLLTGLKGEADANKDKVVTAKELFMHVHKNVKTLSRDRQHPVMWGKFSDNMPVIKL